MSWSCFGQAIVMSLPCLCHVRFKYLSSLCQVFFKSLSSLCPVFMVFDEDSPQFRSLVSQVLAYVNHLMSCRVISCSLMSCLVSYLLLGDEMTFGGFSFDEVFPGFDHALRHLPVRQTVQFERLDKLMINKHQLINQLLINKQTIISTRTIRRLYEINDKIQL